MPPRAPNAGKARVLGRRDTLGGLGRIQSMQDMPLDILVEVQHHRLEYTRGRQLIRNTP